MSQSNPIELVIVVSGQPTTVKVNPQQKVEQLIHEALQQSGNKGQPPSEWELRRSDGGLIDHSGRIDAAGISAGMTLYLSPRAGAGGSV
jgi:hypothetical protein